MGELKYVRGADTVLTWLQKLSRRYPTNLKVVVGYRAPYALAVHENIEMAGQGLPRRSGHGLYWDPQGKAQAKFLEQPAREYKRAIAEHIRRVTKQSKSLRQGLLSGGRILMIASQELVPVDTGELKASAYYGVEEESY